MRDSVFLRSTLGSPGGKVGEEGLIEYCSNSFGGPALSRQAVPVAQRVGPGMRTAVGGTVRA